MIITRTPYRLSFFGGGTDYRPWFEQHGGVIIASALARYCYLTVRKLPPFFEHKTRIVYSRIESVQSVDEIIHPSIKHCLKFLNIEDGLEIHNVGDLPARSGIGSSSSFTVGLLHALHALNYRMVSQRQLADEAIHVEQRLIGEHVGIQDQIMAAFGGMQIIEMGPGDRYTTRPLILPPDYLNALENHILLGFSGISRESSQYAHTHIENIKQCKSSDILTEISSLAQDALKAFIRNDSLELIGSLLDKSWRMKRQLTHNLSNNHIDDLYETARKAGAFGGKLMGAGGGGFIFFLAPPQKHEAIKQALSSIKVWVPFKIDMEGTRVIVQNTHPIYHD
ncbi:MAG: kinase [SAR324 cluster bacterium]|nr:kinase [SAR324 cluster bacterium]